MRQAKINHVEMNRFLSWSGIVYRLNGIKTRNKIVLVVLLCLVCSVQGTAQRTADIGIWGGSSTTFGDLTEHPKFQAFNPNFGAYFRYNINTRVGVRAMFLTGSFAEEGVIEGVNWQFDKSVQDLTLQMEINYLKYILGERKTPFSSYITGGIGIASFPFTVTKSQIIAFNPEHPWIRGANGWNSGKYGGDEIDGNVMATTIPFGFGFKYNIGRRLGVGVEYQMRKIFSDELDNLEDPLAYVNNETEVVTYTTEYHNSDWSGYLGVHITYMIYLGKAACPVYDKKKK